MTRPTEGQCNRADTPSTSGQVALQKKAGSPASKAGLRRIVVRAKGRLIGYVDTTYCQWCTDEVVCSACGAEADAMRAEA